MSPSTLAFSPPAPRHPFLLPLSLHRPTPNGALVYFAEPLASRHRLHHFRSPMQACTHTLVLCLSTGLVEARQRCSYAAHRKGEVMAPTLQHAHACTQQAAAAAAAASGGGGGQPSSSRLALLQCASAHIALLQLCAARAERGGAEAAWVSSALREAESVYGELIGVGAILGSERVEVRRAN
eukprot:3498210-Pleurochrysis_carterae.AAC.1